MASDEATLAGWRAHQHYARVRSWLGTHGRILAQLEAIHAGAQSAADAASPAQLDELRARVAPGVRGALDALALQLDAHSTLEDRKLFPFLQQTFPSRFAGAVQRFAAEHRALDRAADEVEAALEALERALASMRAKPSEVRACAAPLRDAAAALREAMRAHFVAEEERCVELMLGLSAEQAEAYGAFQLVPAPRSKL